MESKASHRTLQPGEMLNWYRIERILGRGGFGVIYLATDTNLDHQVAIKEYIPSDVAHRAGDSKVHPITEDHSDMFRWGMDRFIKEARNLVKFKHPNIVRVMSVFQENNTAYMVMEFEEGEDLRSFLRKPDANNEATLKQLILPVSKGLAEVHRHGFIHRDIKPANILVRKDGSPVLLDFGSARNASKFTQQSLTALVSVGYAPLEQYNSETDEQQGPWTDIYALGGTLYYAISGKDPIESTRRGAALLNGGKDPLIAATYLGEGKYSPAFLSAIDWALQFGIADRPQTLADWIPALLTDNTDPITGLAPHSSSTAAPITRSGAGRDQAVANQSSVDTKTMNELSDATVLSRERRSFRSNAANSAPPINDTTDGAGNGLRNLAMLALLMSGVALGLWFLTSQQQADQDKQALPATQSEQQKQAQIDADAQAARARDLQNEQARQAAEEQAAAQQAVDEQARLLEQQKAQEVAEQLAAEAELKAQNEAKAAAEEQARLAAEKETREAELAAQQEAQRAAEAQRKRDAERAALEAKRLAEARQERRLKQAITAAQNSLSVGDFSAAKTQLGIAQGINADDARVQTFGFVLQAALDEHNLPVSDADFDEVTRRFDALRRAIETKDTDALDRLAISSRQSELFKSLMRNFERVDVSIAGIRVRNADKSITGLLRIDALVRANGDRSSLSEANATRTITSRRVNGGWSKIEW